jgi:hypothetical protein
MHIGSARQGSTPGLGLRMQSRRLLCKAVEETAGVAAGVETLVAAILVVRVALAAATGRVAAAKGRVAAAEGRVAA